MSWQQLSEIAKANRQAWADAEREKQDPYECPVCGWPIQKHNGIYNCPLGHWSWPTSIMSAIRHGGKND